MKHSPEPWTNKTKLGYIVDVNSDLITDRHGFIEDADEERAIECVNALAGVKNPGLVLATLIYRAAQAAHKLVGADSSYRHLVSSELFEALEPFRGLSTTTKEADHAKE